MLIQLIVLRVVSITSGRVKMYYMIIMLKFMDDLMMMKYDSGAAPILTGLHSSITRGI